MTVLLFAAVLEVGGDAVIRAGLRRRAWAPVALGAMGLAVCGVAVSLLQVDFAKVLAGYVAFFALVSVAFGHIIFRETIPRSTWIGIGVMLVGSAVVQLGAAR